MQSAAASSNYLFVRIAEKAVQVFVEALELRWLITRGLFLGILGSVGRDKLAQLLRAHLLAVVILRSGGFRGLVLRLRTARASVGGTVPSGIRMSAALRGLPVPAARLCLSLSRNAEPGALKIHNNSSRALDTDRIRRDTLDALYLGVDDASLVRRHYIEHNALAVLSDLIGGASRERSQRRLALLAVMKKSIYLLLFHFHL